MSWIKAAKAKQIANEVKHKDEKIKKIKDEIAELINTNCSAGRYSVTYSTNEDIDEKCLREIMSELKSDGYRATWNAGKEIMGDYGYPCAYQQAYITISWGE